MKKNIRVSRKKKNLIINLNGEFINNKLNNIFLRQIIFELEINKEIVNCIPLKIAKIFFNNYYLIQLLFENEIFSLKTRVFTEDGKKYTLMGYAKRVYNNNLQEQILDYNLYKKRKKKIT
jgi:hypothetical protein